MDFPLSVQTQVPGCFRCQQVCVYFHIQIPQFSLLCVFQAFTVSKGKTQDWGGSESIQAIRDPWCNISLLPPLSLAVFGDLSAWMFCLSTTQKECLWGLGIALPVRRSNAVTRKKRNEDQAIQGRQGRGRVIPPLSGPVDWGGENLSVLTLSWSQRSSWQGWQSMMAHCSLLCLVYALFSVLIPCNTLSCQLSLYEFILISPPCLRTN